jgi:Tfp pilus assembly protein PilV
VKNRDRARALQRGFSVAESLLAFVVLVIATMGTLGALASTFSNVDQNSYRIQAVAAAQEYMDSLRYWETNVGSGATPAPPTIQMDAGDTDQGGGTALTSPGTFNFTTVPATCTQTGAGGSSSKEYNCTVTVSWTVNGFTRQLEVESYVTQQ